MRSFNTPFVYVSVLLGPGTSGARSSLWWVPSPCEIDIRWPSWQEQYYIQLPFSRGQLIYVCRLNICLCVCSSVPDPRVWPHQTQLSTLYIHVFFPLSAFFSPFIFFPWIPPSRILPLKITCIEPHLIHFNPPPPLKINQRMSHNPDSPRLLPSLLSSSAHLRLLYCTNPFLNYNGCVFFFVSFWFQLLKISQGGGGTCCMSLMSVCACVCVCFV